MTPSAGRAASAGDGGRAASASERVETRVETQILAKAEEIKARGETKPRPARDPVNQPMVNNWVEAMGDENPRYAAGEAPPAMAQVWTMGGLRPRRDGQRGVDDPLHSMMETLTEAGYTAVLGTNCEQTYERYLRVGEQLTVTTRLDSVVGPKQTGVGEGYFVTTRNTWRVADENGHSEVVASMLFRLLKFRPRTVVEERGESASKPQAPPTGEFVLRPMVNRDSAYFWEGTKAGELRIQRCGACGALRHPPGPACPECLALEREYVVASGRGTVFSYVVHRHPPVPGKELPILLALVDLEEGVRMVAELRGVEPEEIQIGMAVQAGFERLDAELTLPVWRVG